ncbi:MAG: ribulose-phosphate 3-epimerase [Patescibacteria group bacterium]|nr:ribulose-phosphate 3-epimerase [Patescibacteria group bacterium]
MIIIPVANCQDFKSLKKRILQIKNFGSAWAHIDIIDGKFAKTLTWSNPEDLNEIKNQIKNLQIEVHLMVERPEDVLESWLKMGVKRVIVHVEAISHFEFLKNKCKEFNVEFGIALKASTPVAEFLPYLEEVGFAQVLAVEAGPSGQEFQESAIEKVKALKLRAPNILVEVDGGINPKTAKLAVEAGADIVASSSYIFGSRNPEKTYKELVGIS